MTICDDAVRNREVWTVTNRQHTAEAARRSFTVEALHELQAPPDAVTHPYYDFVTADWARRWPSEEIWVARKAP